MFKFLHKLFSRSTPRADATTIRTDVPLDADILLLQAQGLL